METQRNTRETAPRTTQAGTSVVAEYCPAILSFVATDVLYPVHAHPGYEIFYVTDGAGVVYVGGSCLRVRTGDLVLSGDRVAHGYAMDAGSTALMTGADAKTTRVFASYAEQAGLDYLVLRGIPRESHLSETLWYMANNRQRMKEGVHLVNSLTTVLDCLVGIIEARGCARRCPKRSRMDEFGLAAYPAIVTRHASAAQVARELNVSPTYFSRTFGQLMGIPYPVYSAIALVNGARRLLAQTDLPASSIAQACGYRSLRSFNRQFHAIAGMTPTEYRERQAPTQIVEFGTCLCEGELCRHFRGLLDASPRPEYADLSRMSSRTHLKA